MTDGQKAVYQFNMGVCALVEALGMISENMQRASLGHSMAYDDKAFFGLIEQYGIHVNACMSLFQGD